MTHRIGCAMPESGVSRRPVGLRSALVLIRLSDLERGINLTARKDTARLLADALKLAGPTCAMSGSTARGQLQAADSGVTEATAAVPSASAVHALPRHTASFT
jgi:hypothetical protein